MVATTASWRTTAIPLWRAGGGTVAGRHLGASGEGPTGSNFGRNLRGADYLLDQLHLSSARTERKYRDYLVYRAKGGRWAAQGWAWRDGERIRATFYARTEREALAKLRAAQRAYEDGVALPPARLMVGSFLAEWLVTIQPTVRPSTFLSYSGIVRRDLVPTLGFLPLRTLQPSHVDALLRAKLAGGLSPRRVQYIRAVLRRALGQAVRWGQASRNVAQLVTPPKVERARIAPLTPDEARRFIGQVGGNRLEALYVVALATGMRQGELLGLRWSDVTLEESRLQVRQALGIGPDGKPAFTAPKSKSSLRDIALPRIAVDALRAHRLRQLAERLRLGQVWKDLDLVFASAAGTPLNSQNLTRAFQRHLAAAGIPRRRFHDLRHSAATFLMMQGVSARVVQEMLGHSSVTLTLDTYSHVLPELKRAAATTMDSVLVGDA